MEARGIPLGTEFPGLEVQDGVRPFIMCKRCGLTISGFDEYDADPAYDFMVEHHARLAEGGPLCPRLRWEPRRKVYGLRLANV